MSLLDHSREETQGRENVGEKGSEVSASLQSTWSTLAAAAAQIYRLFIFIFHQESALNEKEKKKNHIQVNDARRRIGDMTSEWSVKCPLGSMVLEKGVKQKHRKRRNIFVRNVLLYIQWQSQLFLSNTRALTHTASF